MSFSFLSPEPDDRGNRLGFKYHLLCCLSWSGGCSWDPRTKQESHFFLRELNFPPRHRLSHRKLLYRYCMNGEESIWPVG